MKRKVEVSGSRTITESSLSQKGKHFTKAGDQDSNEKRMIDWDYNSQIDMEIHKQNIVKEVIQEEAK